MLSDINTQIKKVLSFLGGITVTFGALGILGALTGKLLTNFMGPYLYLFAGVVTLVAGLNMLDIINLSLPSLFSSIKTKNNFLMGLLYGGVALSCVGPLLSAVLVYITIKASIVYGFLMMYIFSLGFITPFILCGFLITDKKICENLMKHSILIQKIGGVILLMVSAYLLFIALGGIV
jgi:cytochrome c-type biogenesis protein